MSVTLLVGGRDVFLGGTMEVLSAWREIEKAIGDQFSDYADLLVVPFANEEPITDEEYARVQEQAVRAKLLPGLGAHAHWALQQLVGDRLAARPPDRDEFDWREEKHPRYPKGDPRGGKFKPAEGTPVSTEPVSTPVSTEPVSTPVSTEPVSGEGDNDGGCNTDTFVIGGSEVDVDCDDIIGNRGVHEAYRVKTPDGKEYLIKAEDTSIDPQSPLLGRAIESDGLLSRELVAPEIAKLTGDGDLVPGVIEVKAHQENGEVVKATAADWVENAVTGANYPANEKVAEKDWERAAYFDFIIGNTDRHPGNWMVNRGTGKLSLVDNDMILPNYDLERESDLHGDVRLEYMKSFASLVDSDVNIQTDQVQRWRRAWPNIEEVLRKGGFAPGVIEGASHRLEYLESHVGTTWLTVLGDYDHARHGHSNIWGH